MKSDILTRIDGERYYLACDCLTPGHIIAFDLFPKGILEDNDSNFGNGTCDIYFVDKWVPSFWQRCKTAFNYVFRKKNIVYHNIAIPLDAYKEFKEVADAMERCYNKTQASK